MIPRILHQTGPLNWLMNPIWNDCQPGWQSMQGWEYRFWTDADNRELVATLFPQYLDLYDSLLYEINRVDMVRYLYLYAFGGFYVDLDCKCLRSFDSLCGKADIILGSQTLMGTAKVECAVMGSVPGHPFWLSVMDEIQASVSVYAYCPLQSLYIINTTGPFMLTRCVERERDKYNMWLAPQSCFFPPTEYSSYAIHFCGRSWIDSDLERWLSELHNWKPPIGPLLLWLLFTILLVLVLYILYQTTRAFLV